MLKLVDSVPRRGAIEHYYTAVARPRITDQAWAASPSVVKQATVASALSQIGSYVSAAASAGGFDAAETHLTRSPVTVDEKGWQALARELEGLSARIQKIEAESTARLVKSAHDSEQEATVVLMLYHSAPDANATATAPNRASRISRRPSSASRRRSTAVK